MCEKTTFSEFIGIRSWSERVVPWTNVIQCTVHFSQDLSCVFPEKVIVLIERSQSQLRQAPLFIRNFSSCVLGRNEGAASLSRGRLAYLGLACEPIHQSV